MLSVYPACFFKEETGYSVIFPDLDWLSTCGDTVDDAMNRAVDCLAGYLYAFKREGNAYPVSSSLADIHIDYVANELELEQPGEDSFVNLISVDVEVYAKKHFEKSVKKTLTIPAWLNQAALEEGINFSQVLQEALICKLNELKK